jgi:hypothetical protein
MAAGEERWFRLGRRPEGTTRLPWVLEIPLPAGPLVLATREPWPSTGDLYCHPLKTWPEDADEVDRVRVVEAWRRGAALHLTLDRRQRRRSLFVFAEKGGRSLVFWRTQRTMGQSRPSFRVPAARALKTPLTIVVDHRERYPWQFRRFNVERERAELACGDYAARLDGRYVAVAERKSVADLLRSLNDGSLRLALAELSGCPRAALFVEGRLSDVAKAQPHRAAWHLNVLAALQAEFPRVGWIFADTRQWAEDLAYRWMAAAAQLEAKAGADDGEPLGHAPRVRADSAARRRDALEAARDGRVWTMADYRQTYGVSYNTAARDLQALAADGELVVDPGKPLRFRARLPEPG